MAKLFTVDAALCKKDGSCAKECPALLITQDNDDRLPTPIDRAERMCINCGHCAAICKTGAFKLNHVASEQFPLVDQEQIPTPAQAKTFLTGRRSIRAYQKQPVEQAKIAEIIDIARYAPSAVNIQPVQWLAIMDPQEVRRLTEIIVDWMRQVMAEQPEVARNTGMKPMVLDWEKGVDRICRSAPHIVVAHGPEADGSAQSACTIALAYLELAAFANGLGACWAGYFHSATAVYPPMGEALALPEGNKCYGAMLVGYPQHKFHRLPPRKEASIIWR